jgi:MFS family permease
MRVGQRPTRIPHFIHSVGVNYWDGFSLQPGWLPRTACYNPAVMELFRYLREGNWTTPFGYAFFTGMLAVGYYYNVTFVQLGLVDLGERLIGLSRTQVASSMAYLALITSLVALLVGIIMMKRGWSRRFIVKLRLAFGVILVQTILTALAPHLRSESGYLAWIAAASLALGVGVPVTFGMTVDLIPRRDRGYVAAAITALAYFAAPVFSAPWEIENFSRQMLFIMVPAVPILGLLAFKRFPFIERLAQQHTLPEFWYGRYVLRSEAGSERISWRLVGLIVLMFGVFFVDSLGFLRMTDTPRLMESAWTSPDPGPRLFIGWVHVAAAVAGGVLYSALPGRSLFYWIFGLFGLVHLMYTFPIRFGEPAAPPLMMPALYAMAVSLYTVVNFAIWADLSTPRTISRNAALGVALSGWSATFISTALAIRWGAAGLPLEQHLRIVDSLAILFFLAMLFVAWLPSKKEDSKIPPGRE